MPSPKNLTAEELRKFFIHHLNKVYCAKSELLDKLPEMKKQVGSVSLIYAIEETMEAVANQVERMKAIFIAMDTHYRPESCTGLIGMLDEAFQSVGGPGESPEYKDFSLLFYMQNIEGIELASFKMLLLVAHMLEAQGLAQLLQECYDEAREDKALFKAIMAEYQLDGN